MSQPIAVVCAIEEELQHLRVLLPPAREGWRGRRVVWLTWKQALPHDKV